MGTDLGSVDEELVHRLLQGDPTGEVDLVDEVLGVQFLLTSPTLLTVLGLQGGLNLPFRPVWEGQNGLVVPPLPIQVDGTHGTRLLTKVNRTRLQSVLHASYIRKRYRPNRYKSTTYRRLIAPDISENPRVASSIVAPAIANQRLTTFWVVTNLSTFVLHGGETGVRLPSVVSKLKSM